MYINVGRREGRGPLVGKQLERAHPNRSYYAVGNGTAWVGESTEKTTVLSANPNRPRCNLVFKWTVTSGTDGNSICLPGSGASPIKFLCSDQIRNNTSKTLQVRFVTSAIIPVHFLRLFCTYKSVSSSNLHRCCVGKA